MNHFDLIIILQWQQSLHYCMTGLKMHSSKTALLAPKFHFLFNLDELITCNTIRSSSPRPLLPLWLIPACIYSIHTSSLKPALRQKLMKNDLLLILNNLILNYFFPANAVVHFLLPATGGAVGWCSCRLHGCLILPLLLTADY